jgi:hypothetical protein
MTDSTKQAEAVYTPRRKPTPEERLVAQQQKMQEAEFAVRDYFVAEQHRVQNMQRLRALRRKAEAKKISG